MARSLTARQMDQVWRRLNHKVRRQHGFDFGLWARSIVAALIVKLLGMRLSLISTGRLLASLGITPQKRLRQAYEHDHEAIRKWDREDHSGIRTRARRRGVGTFFLDEAAVHSDSQPDRTWSALGQTPVHRCSVRVGDLIEREGG